MTSSPDAETIAGGLTYARSWAESRRSSADSRESGTPSRERRRSKSGSARVKGEKGRTSASLLLPLDHVSGHGRWLCGDRGSHGMLRVRARIKVTPPTLARG
jgi:hypothetical protein